MFSAFMEPGVPAIVFWVFVGLAIVIQGISKSGFAGGAGILSLPLMLLVMPVDKVAATLLPLLIPIGSWLGHWMHHRVSESQFNRVIGVLVLIGGLQLLTNVNILLVGLRFFFHPPA